jgi:hypothetical protein
LTTPLERDIAAAEANGDLNRVDELNACKLARLMADSDGNGHAAPPQPPTGIPPQDPRTGDLAAGVQAPAWRESVRLQPVAALSGPDQQRPPTSGAADPKEHPRMTISDLDARLAEAERRAFSAEPGTTACRIAYAELDDLNAIKLADVQRHADRAAAARLAELGIDPNPTA